MKIIKILAIAVVVIIAIPLIVALFLPKQYTISVSTVIDKPKREVFDFVKTIKRQHEYSVWMKADTTSKVEYKGTDGTVGFIQSWNSTSDEVGEGEQEIIRLTEDSMVVELRFKRPFESTASAATICTMIDSTHTKVTADFYANDKYPFNIFQLVGKGMITEAQTQNLKNMKAILEK